MNEKTIVTYTVCYFIDHKEVRNEKKILVLLFSILSPLIILNAQFEVKPKVEISILYEDGVTAIPSEVLLYSDASNYAKAIQIKPGNNFNVTFYDVPPGKCRIGLKFNSQIYPELNTTYLNEFYSDTYFASDEETGRIFQIHENRSYNSIEVRRGFNHKVSLTIKKGNKYIPPGFFGEGDRKKFSDFDCSELFFYTLYQGEPVSRPQQDRTAKEGGYDCETKDSTQTTTMNEVTCSNEGLSLKVGTLTITNLIIEEFSDLNNAGAQMMKIGEIVVDKVTNRSGPILGKFTAKVNGVGSIESSECKEKGSECKCFYTARLDVTAYTIRVWVNPELIKSLKNYSDSEDDKIKICCQYKALILHELCHCPQFLERMKNSMPSIVSKICDAINPNYDCKSEEQNCCLDGKCENEAKQLAAKIGDTFNKEYKNDEDSVYGKEEKKCGDEEVKFFNECLNTVCNL